MSFLRNFTEVSRSIVSSVIIMAKRLGIKTLVEGVETKEQADYLASIGCGRQQGYYYGKPQPLTGVLAHMEAEGRTTEPRKWFHFYDMASMSIHETDRTSALTRWMRQAISAISIRTNPIGMKSEKWATA